MGEKCFCHFNGYQVKDAAARAEIAKMSRSVIGNRKFIFISDSYGRYTNAEGKNWIDLLCEKCGISESNYYSVHTGSSGFTRSGNLKWLTMLQEAEITNKSEITDIVVGGGANDTLADYETNIAAIEEFMEYVQSDFPNAVVSLAHFGITFGKNETYARAYTSLKAYREAARWGAKYIMNSEYILCNTTLLQSDRVHPNQDGVNSIANNMISAITEGYCDVHYNVVATSQQEVVDQFENFDTDNSGNVRMYVSNNVAVMAAGGAGVMLSLGSTTGSGIIHAYSAGVFYRNLISLSDSVTTGTDRFYKTFSGLMRVTLNTGEKQTYPVMYFLEDYTNGRQNVSVYVEGIPNIEAVREVAFMMGTAVLPTDM